MKENWKKYFMKWSETNHFHEKLKEANDIISSLSTEENVGILFSGGKDSTVGLHLALQHVPDIHIFHYDFSYNVPREIAEEIVKNLRAIGGKNICIMREYTKVKGDRGFFSAANKFLHAKKIDIIIGCLREEESGKRKRLIAEGEGFLGVKNVFPIGTWGWRDIWAYIVRNDLPYPCVYDKYAEFYGWDKARFSAFFSEDLDYLGARNVDNVLMWKFKNML